MRMVSGSKRKPSSRRMAMLRSQLLMIITPRAFINVRPWLLGIAFSKNIIMTKACAP